MNSFSFHIEPRDLLFMRDGRPMEASDAGLGANWPRPDQIYSAFINTFHAQWSDFQSWEGHRHNQNDRDTNKDSSYRFGSLKTAGPFPAKGKEIYLPCPLDLSADDNGCLYPMKLVEAKNTDMPKPLTHAFSSVKLGKTDLPQWISSADYQKYLKGESFKSNNAELYDVERNIGIAIDPATGTTEEGKLYQAEYLRFKPETKMAISASCEIGLDKLLDKGRFDMIMGGQQGVCMVSQVSDLSLPSSCSQNIPHSLFLKWTLISPSVYPKIGEHPGGWLPSWIDSLTGQVLLPKGNTERRSGEKREVWRKRVEIMEKFMAKLVAARIGKPLAFSGWDLQSGAKPTYLAAPAGSAYIFKCKDIEEVKALSDALSWNGATGNEVKNRRSTLFGEKGFGLGICSQIKI
ncbi:MAG: hypothetical protein A2X47_10200 [Lentisphaerae bacterium GWF2_38_69]|nr:MAG: hypothetical protein A2X47_10200 [Lentisphaerae bacterium GWF2_38_69]